MDHIEAININSNWFYHYITPTIFQGIIEREGILSRRKLHNLKRLKIYMTPVFSGYDYISVARKQNVDMSSYNYFCVDAYSLIIENKKAHKAHYIKKDIRINNINVSDILSSLPIPIRFSSWQDEYQIKDIVPLKNIIGIKLPEEKTIYYQESSLSDFISIIEETGFTLPFIDIENKKQIPHTKVKQYLLEQYQ